MVFLSSLTSASLLTTPWHQYCKSRSTQRQKHSKTEYASSTDPKGMHAQKFQGLAPIAVSAEHAPLDPDPWPWLDYCMSSWWHGGLYKPCSSIMEACRQPWRRADWIWFYPSFFCTTHFHIGLVPLGWAPERAPEEHQVFHKALRGPLRALRGGAFNRAAHGTTRCILTPHRMIPGEDKGKD